MGRIGGHKCMIIGHHKGRDTKEKIACNFGCAHPEGYRKAMAKMQFAEKFGLPIVTFLVLLLFGPTGSAVWLATEAVLLTIPFEPLIVT